MNKSLVPPFIGFPDIFKVFNPFKWHNKSAKGNSALSSKESFIRFKFSKVLLTKAPNP